MTAQEMLNPISTNECITKITANKDHGYKWFTCIGKNGCIFELGGRNRETLIN